MGKGFPGDGSFPYPKPISKDMFKEDISFPGYFSVHGNPNTADVVLKIPVETGYTYYIKEIGITVIAKSSWGTTADPTLAVGDIVTGIPPALDVDRFIGTGAAGVAVAVNDAGTTVTAGDEITATGYNSGAGLFNSVDLISEGPNAIVATLSEAGGTTSSDVILWAKVEYLSWAQPGYSS